MKRDLDKEAMDLGMRMPISLTDHKRQLESIRGKIGFWMELPTLSSQERSKLNQLRSQEKFLLELCHYDQEGNRID